MMFWLNLLILSITGVVHGDDANLTSNVVNFTMFLLYEEPYVNKDMTGIIPDQIRILNQRCTHTKIDVRFVSWTREEAKDLVSSANPKKYLRNKENFTGPNFIIGAWFHHPLHRNEKVTQFLIYRLVKSPGLVGIVHRDLLSVGRKLLDALNESLVLMYNGFLMASFVGILVWLLENKSNPMFDQNLASGILNGMWFGVVTMTTVGYGDICPKSGLGKLISIIFMFIALLTMASLTSLSNERIMNGGIDLRKLKLAVVNYSRSLQWATNLHKHGDKDLIHKTSTFSETIKKLSNSEVESALVDYNIASWYQDEILKKDFRFASFMAKPFWIDMFIYEEEQARGGPTTRLMECLSQNAHLLERINDDYIRDISVIAIDVVNLSDAVSSVGITTVVSTTFVIGAIILLVHQLVTRRNKKIIPIDFPKTRIIDVLENGNSKDALGDEEKLKILDKVKRQLEESKQIIETLSRKISSSGVSFQQPSCSKCQQ